MRWSSWYAPLVVMLAGTGLAWGQMAPLPAPAVEGERYLLVGDPPQKCRVLASWRMDDGRKAYDVESLGTGEVMTLYEVPDARSHGLLGKLRMRIAHWGSSRTRPSGFPAPPPGTTACAACSGGCGGLACASCGGPGAHEVLTVGPTPEPPAGPGMVMTGPSGEHVAAEGPPPFPADSVLLPDMAPQGAVAQGTGASHPDEGIPVPLPAGQEPPAAGPAGEVISQGSSGAPTTAPALSDLASQTPPGHDVIMPPHQLGARTALPAAPVANVPQAPPWVAGEAAAPAVPTAPRTTTPLQQPGPPELWGRQQWGQPVPGSASDNGGRPASWPAAWSAGQGGPAPARPATAPPGGTTGPVASLPQVPPASPPPAAATNPTARAPIPPPAATARKADPVLPVSKATGTANDPFLNNTPYLPPGVQKRLGGETGVAQAGQVPPPPAPVTPASLPPPAPPTAPGFAAAVPPPAPPYATPVPGGAAPAPAGGSAGRVPLGAQSVLAAYDNGADAKSRYIYVPVPIVTEPKPVTPPTPPAVKVPAPPRPPDPFTNAFTPPASRGPGQGAAQGPAWNNAFSTPDAGRSAAQGMGGQQSGPAPGMPMPMAQYPGMMPGAQAYAMMRYPYPPTAGYPAGPMAPYAAAAYRAPAAAPAYAPPAQAAYANPAMDRPGMPVAMPTAAAPNPTAVQNVTALLRTSLYPSQREWCAGYLAAVDWHANAQVVPALLSAAREDPAPSVRAACVHCLGRMNVHGDLVSGTLQGLCHDPDAGVRTAAEQALARIAPAAGAPPIQPVGATNP